jgi:hypothetical protein
MADYMVDFAMECYRNLHPDESVPEGLLLCIYF